jgi:hypothetical protein
MQPRQKAYKTTKHAAPETTHQGNIKASNQQDNQTYNTATNAAQPPQANSATTAGACRMSLHEHRS